MEIIDKVLDLPVIIQGALGSFLFWLVYEFSKRFFDLALEFGTRLNYGWRMEYLLSQQSHALQEVLVGKDSRLPNMSVKLLSIQVAVNRSIHGIIYIILGLISKPLIGNLSIVAFFVALAYFYRALKASHVDIESKHSTEWYESKVEKISEEIKLLQEKKCRKTNQRA
ncbi:hypothetical protein [Vibrio cholerae]|uniref:hypothetical protein n=1 Tax=Vibrio cholerae TaxID=666 RepID=UPI000E0C5ED4|nr:hypothetical protein [Vibrio cholerae]